MFVKTVSAAIAAGAFVSLASAQTAPFGAAGLSENFDSMGTTGTAAPTGWKHFVTAFGSNATWATSIPASGTNSMASVPVTSAATNLTAVTNPSGTNNNGFNAAANASTPSDRVLTPSPTTVAGAIIQLAMSNATGAEIGTSASFTLNFDIVRHTAASTANQLPGFNVFLSMDGATWTQLAPTLTLADVPNSVGVSSRTISFSLTSAWSDGATAYLRFVDDNAQQTSPDQLIGLNNVRLTATGTDSCAWHADGCSADYNNDGSIDGDDVIAFFADWDGGLSCADADTSTSVDGDDVIVFFGAWDAGGVGFPGC